MRGKVILVGAGPGNIGLLTLRGVKAIKKADAVIYDRLAGKEILNIIPEGAEKIDAGKEKANHKIRQEEINRLLLEKANSGKNVVRLKGGDSFVFGRGGEEIEFLAENGVDFEVIPGVSSVSAVPAYAGIPLTHRNFSSSVHIFSGHGKNGSAGIDFKNCVLSGGTLVFLMSVSNMEYIANGLISGGMNKKTPCAVIENGTMPKQRKVISNISEISNICKKENIKTPAVFVIGEVCSLSRTFDWFDRLPLRGKKIIVTRPGDRNGEISEKFKRLGAEVIECPCIETEGLIDDELFNDIIKKINEYDVIVFTSPSGVKYVFDSFFERKTDGRIFYGKKIAVIGSATGGELKKYGLFYDYMPDCYNGKSLGKMLVKNSVGKKILLLRAKDASDDIIKEFKRHNIEYFDMAAYRTKYSNGIDKETAEKIIGGEIDYITFTSVSTVKAFTSFIQKGYGKFTGICIGEKTGAEAAKHGIKTIVSKNAAANEMVSAVVSEVI